MSIQAVGMRAYSEAVQNFSKVQGSLQQGNAVGSTTQFAKTLDQSLLRDSVDRGEGFGAHADFIKYPTQAHTPVTPQNSFSGTIKSSLNKVNELDAAKNLAIDDFASIGRDMAARGCVLGPEGEAGFAWMAQDLNSIELLFQRLEGGAIVDDKLAESNLRI